MRDFVNRVGAAGLIVIFSLVFFAFLAGGIVAHRLNASNSSAVQQQGNQADQQGDQKDETQGEANGQAKPPLRVRARATTRARRKPLPSATEPHVNKVA